MDRIRKAFKNIPVKLLIWLVRCSGFPVPVHSKTKFQVENMSEW